MFAVVSVLLKVDWSKLRFYVIFEYGLSWWVDSYWFIWLIKDCMSWMVLRLLNFLGILVMFRSEGKICEFEMEVDYDFWKNLEARLDRSREDLESTNKEWVSSWLRFLWECYLWTWSVGKIKDEGRVDSKEWAIFFWMVSKLIFIFKQSDSERNEDLIVLIGIKLFYWLLLWRNCNWYQLLH